MLAEPNSAAEAAQAIGTTLKIAAALESHTHILCGERDD
jgi:hypothetical protein